MSVRALLSLAKYRQLFNYEGFSNMNTSTTKIQNSPSLNDQAEAIFTTLEQASSAFFMLSRHHEKSPDHAVFLLIEETLDKAKQQTNDLIGELPNGEEERALSAALKQQRADLNDIAGRAYELVGVGKAINLWACEQPIKQTEHSELDAGDIISLSSLIQTLSNAIVAKADKASPTLVQEVAV
jgi:hypothetical protein